MDGRRLGRDDVLMRLSIVGIAITVLVACDSGVNTDAGTDASMIDVVDAARADAGDASADATPDAADASDVPSSTPDGIGFVDTDATCFEVAGTVTVVRPLIETDITSYALYWGSDPTTKLSQTPIAVLPKTGGNPTYVMPTTPVPMGAYFLLAFSRNANGEMPTGVAAVIGEGSLVDISAGQPANSGLWPSAVMDAANSKLLVVTQNGANSNKLGLFRCDLAGANCTYTDISAGQGANSGMVPSAVVDTVNAKLLVVTQNDASSSKPGLFRCNLDGTSCTYTDIGAASTGITPSAIIDAANSKLLVATNNNANSNKPALVRCNLDGTSCGLSDISAGQPANSGYSPTALVDAPNGKLLVVTNVGKPLLFRCNLDGSSCAFTDISSNVTQSSQQHATLDIANGKLLVTTNYKMSLVGLFRCNLDGTSCGWTDVTAGAPGFFAGSPTPVVDTAINKLLVVNNGLRRCNLDGTGCAWIGLGGGYTPVLDPNAVLRVVSGGSMAKPGLYTPCVR